MLQTAHLLGRGKTDGTAGGRGNRTPRYVRRLYDSCSGHHLTDLHPSADPENHNTTDYAQGT